MTSVAMTSVAMTSVAMTNFAAALLLWTLISPSSGGGHGTEEHWPTHRACSNEGLELLYQSCDPLQDFGFSVDQCSRHLKPNLNIRFGIILREDIRELFLDISLMNKGSSILNYTYPICEEDLPKFSFCGRKKGEKIYYSGPINNPAFEVYKGVYQVLAEVYNEKRSIVACANATLICS